MIVIIFDEKNNWVAKDESDYDCSSMSMMTKMVPEGGN